MTPRWKMIMALTLAAALAGHWGWRLLLPTAPLQEQRYLSYLFPEADEFGPKEGTPPHFVAWSRLPSGGRRPVGLAWLSSDVLPDERGYAGPIHILVGQHLDGTIAAIRVLAHQETPSYAAAIDRPEFWARFSGKGPADSFIPGEDVDAISRATITSEAVARAVRDGSRIMARDVLNLRVPPPARERPRTPWHRLLFTALGVLLALVSWLIGAKTPRNLVLLYSTAVLGFWLGAYLSLGQLANLLLGRGAPIMGHLDWYLLLGAAVLLALLAGNLFCGWLCPFGALQELLWRLTGRRGAPIPPEAAREADKLRWAFLWITLLVSFLLGTADAAGYEPFAVVFDRKGTLLHLALAVAALGGSLFVFRFWCRFFCPVGVIMQLVSAGRLGRRLKFSLQRDVLERGELSNRGPADIPEDIY